MAITKEQYRQISDKIYDWLDIYRGLFMRRRVAREYKALVKYLKKNLSDDPDLAENVKTLPNHSIWMLTPWLIEVIWSFVALTFFILNERYFKMYAGIEIQLPRGVGKLDGLLVVFTFFFAGIYVLLRIKRENVAENLVNNLREMASFTGFKSSGRRNE